MAIVGANGIPFDIGKSTTCILLHYSLIQGDECGGQPQAQTSKYIATCKQIEGDNCMSFDIGKSENCVLLNYSLILGDE